MPDYIALLSVTPDFDALPEPMRDVIANAKIRYPSVDEEFDTWDTLNAASEALAQALPALTCDVVVRFSDWILFSCLYISDGAVAWEEVDFSTSPDARFDPRAEPAPEVEVEVDAVADAFEDVFAKACGERVYEADAFSLPFDYDSVEAMVELLATVAGHLVRPCDPVITAVGDAFYRCVLDRQEGVFVQPLWPWADDSVLRQRLHERLPQPLSEPRTASATRLAAAPALDIRSPLTSGSARGRVEAAYGVAARARERHVGKEPQTNELIPDADAWRQLANAIAAPENREAQFDDVRGELYELLCRFDVPDQERFLLEHLAQEPDSVRARAYPGMLALGRERLDRHVATKFCTGTSTEVETIAQVIWRSDRAVQSLVEEHLVPAFAADPPLAKRIIELLEEEHIRVSRAWLGDAPTDLVHRLRRLLD